MGGGIDFIQFNIIRQWSKNGEFKVDRFVTKTEIIDEHTFEAMNFGQDSYFYTLCLKCIRREIYLKALDLANVKRKITTAEDILASIAILGVSKKIALLDEALYYYCFNEQSSTNSNDTKNLAEKVENTLYVISKFKTFVDKKDEQFSVFLRCFILVFSFHTLFYQTQYIQKSYEYRKSDFKWFARLIYSVQKKIINFKRKSLQNKLKSFIKNNEKIF